MQRTQEHWIKEMAENLVCEITEAMSGIHLSCAPSSTHDLGKKQMAGVCALIGGDYTFQVHFLAEPNLFFRFAKNMMGEEPDSEDVRDYAMEFFNTLCGRFISEIINETHIKARLMPIKYEMPARIESLWEQEAFRSVVFTSELDEHAVFVWAAVPLEEMMRRSS